jgi:toxin FitB
VSDRAGYLLDTNVLSETRRKKSDSGVISFLESAETTSLYMSVLTIGEFRKGLIAKQREDADAAARLSSWIDGLELSFADRILGIDVAIAKLLGEWSGERPRSVVDTLLAATAVVHGFTLVTRNVRDIADLPVKTLNPWEEPGG